ncbi:MAG: leucine--tRNA ligase [Phycisphaerae bacterium]|jgi:leucyl-tRNA synthetase
MSATYAFGEIEPRWQRTWLERRTFRAANPGERGSERPKYYVLDFFPYPSGAGLHVGHPLGYIASDIVARHMRMRGFNVLHPMGWDAFGLPAEQYAVETGIHPRITTQKNIETYKRQLQTIGLSYDWERELATCDERYYHWTQWIFLQIYNAWYDPEHHWTDAAGRAVVGGARPIDKLPIPPEVRAGGEAEIAEYRDAHRLAYMAEVPVNWCPALGTVLANEEVTADGRSERGNHPVYRRPMKQWMLRITEYAERLLADLEELDWPEPIKLMQRNWIGRSEGAYVDFRLTSSRPEEAHVIRVFTTRPDTLYGATYLVLAPEHRLVPVVTTPDRRDAVNAYVAQARQKSELDRAAGAREKTGVFTGGCAINPANGKSIPIWVADYVLGSYGTGSIMAVPGSDKRDLEFADAFGLPVVQVVRPPPGVNWRGYEDEGVSVNSPPPGEPHLPDCCDLNGLPTPEAKRKITRWLEERDLGEGTVQYKLRDWLFSRQRYWGEPFPILHRADGRAVAEPESNLPVRLPEIDDFKPHASDDPNAEPQTPLARAADWVHVERDGQRLRRELNTMPQWAGSCWYYLRFCDAQNDRQMVAPAAERYWMGGRRADGRPKIGGVDLYMGGAEHAVLHLLYARFWHKVLYDLGHVSTPEPFHKLFNQGMIGAHSYRDERGVYVPAEQVQEGAEAELTDPDTRQRVRTRFYYQGRPVVQCFDKMSKSKKNVVNPDDIIREYGADTLRLYEMYMGPLEASKPWNTRDIIGVHRFLQRVWRLVIEPVGAVSERGQSAAASPAAPASGEWRIASRIAEAPEPGLERLLHKTIRKVSEDIGRLAFNTAIAQMIVWSNEAQKAPTIGRSQVERFLLLLAPFAPHLCEELWSRLGNADSLAYEPWPTYDPTLVQDDTVEIAVQIKGKLRARIQVPADAPDEQVIEAAKAAEVVAKELAGKSVQRAIVVKGRLVNLIV